jgi:hypothetical protein
VRPYLEKPITKKRAGGVAQGVCPEYKPQYSKNNDNNNNNKTPLNCTLQMGE